MSRYGRIGLWVSFAMLARVRPAVAAPSIGAPLPSQTTLIAGVTTQLIVTSKIVTAPTDPPVLANGVNLLRVDATGATLATVGLMHDDGLNGDAMAGDGIYTIQFLDK
jgi:hypothetical protein